MGEQVGGSLPYHPLRLVPGHIRNYRNSSILLPATGAVIPQRADFFLHLSVGSHPGPLPRCFLSRPANRLLCGCYPNTRAAKLFQLTISVRNAHAGCTILADGYFPGRSTAGIYVAPLDPNNLTHLAAVPKHLFGFDSKYEWERWGEKNEYTGIAWIEGPWMFKRNGRYYIEFSASGTQWLSYASGIYSSKSPLGPFTYSPRNPLLRKTTGIVTGPGHGSVVQGPDGNWWVFYTIVMSNPPGGRRIGMDPIAFDANGNPYTNGPSETPQWAPGLVADPVHNGDSGSIAVSVNKLRAMHGQSSFSSERPGHEAAYATDDSNGTIWQPAENDAQPTLTVDLVAPTEFETGQYFQIDSIRIEFATGSGGPRMVPGAAPAGPPPAPTGSAAFRYKIETSIDGKQFTTVLDKTNNEGTRYTEFAEIPPTRCRYVRLTITDWPHRAGSPLGITEFTVFGKALPTPMQ